MSLTPGISPGVMKPFTVLVEHGVAIRRGRREGAGRGRDPGGSAISSEPGDTIER